MGLDGVEIVMDVEDHFGVSLRDTELADVRTVGDLVALVQDRIAATHREPCPTLSAFLLLRKTTREILADDAARLWPRDAVRTHLSPGQRRTLWNRLSELMGRPLSLRRPKLLRQLLVAVSIALLVVAYLVASAVDVRTWPLTFLFAVGAIIVLHLSTTRFRSVPPEGWMRFGDIATKIAGLKVATRMVHLQTDEEILSEMRPLLVRILGVRETAIVPTARFIEDLAAG
jgi:acyl carrier protein